MKATIALGLLFISLSSEAAHLCEGRFKLLEQSAPAHLLSDCDRELTLKEVQVTELGVALLIAPQLTQEKISLETFDAYSTNSSVVGMSFERPVNRETGMVKKDTAAYDQDIDTLRNRIGLTCSETKLELHVAVYDENQDFIPEEISCTYSRQK